MIVYYRNKTFVISNNPYKLTVLEQSKDGKTVTRTYGNAGDLSVEDKYDLLLARAVDNSRSRSK